MTTIEAHIFCMASLDAKRYAEQVLRRYAGRPDRQHMAAMAFGRCMRILERGLR